jgi:hypothetical protein
VTVPGFVLHAMATITCSHGGQVKIAPSQTRALVNGLPIATALDMMVVGGCPGVGGSPPCTTVKWSAVSARVTCSGIPVLLQPLPPTGPVPGAGVVAGPPPNVPLVASMQLRVSGL